VGSPGWLDRYLAGQRKEVWHELRLVGAAVRAPDVIEEAQLVCDHMAIRARQNVEVIVSRLAEQGYRFHTNDDDETPVVPHHPPGPDAPGLAAWLQTRFDMVPLTLLSWGAWWATSDSSAPIRCGQRQRRRTR
jgi:hypothetical protein